MVSKEDFFLFVSSSVSLSIFITSVFSDVDDLEDSMGVVLLGFSLEFSEDIVLIPLQLGWLKSLKKKYIYFLLKYISLLRYSNDLFTNNNI